MLHPFLIHALGTASLLQSLVVAEEPPYTSEVGAEYRKGDYGIYPEVQFKTTDLHAPRVLLDTWGPECRSGDEKILIAPRGVEVKHPGPIMLDGNGQMVWHDEAFKDHVAYGATVQMYRNNPYLTFWTGSDQHRGIGQGDYYMFDHRYVQYKKISAQRNYTGDLHEFIITPDNTALFTSYVSTPRDLRGQNGPRDGYIWDGIFEEIDIETNELLFEWKATDHFTFEDCYFPLPNKTSAGTKEEPWDWFHINSIEKDKKGNYLISSRYLHALVYLDGKTGEPLWVLGGKNNEFKDLSGGNATNFAWQHHARWANDGRAITIFDNHVMTSDMNLPLDNEPASRALKINIDTETKEVAVVWQLYHPLGYTSVSQGSTQELGGNRKFVCWGASSGFSEYNELGQMICDASFGSMWGKEDHLMHPGGVMSYRGFKVNWVGRPHYEPKVKFEHGIMYVSWNGATEVTKWSLQGTDAMDSDEHEWAVIGETAWQGFENQIEVGPYDYAVYRLVAHGTDGHHEGLWRVFSNGLVETVDIREPPEAKAKYQFGRNAFWMVAGAAVAIAVVYIAQRARGMNFAGGRLRLPFVGAGKHGRTESMNGNGYALVSRSRQNGQPLFDHYQDELRDMISDDDGEEEIDGDVHMGPDVPVLTKQTHSRKPTAD